MSTVSTRPPGLLRGWRLTTYLETTRAGLSLSPGSPLLRVGCYTGIHRIGTFFSQQRNNRGRLAVAIRQRNVLEVGQRHAEHRGQHGERGPQRARVAVRDL